MRGAARRREGVGSARWRRKGGGGGRRRRDVAGHEHDEADPS